MSLPNSFHDYGDFFYAVRIGLLCRNCLASAPQTQIATPRTPKTCLGPKASNRWDHARLSRRVFRC